MSDDSGQRYETNCHSRMAFNPQNPALMCRQVHRWYIQIRKLCQGTDLEQFLQVVIRVAAEQLAAESRGHIRMAQRSKNIGRER